MTSGADVDSSARYPPPSCYPGTRKTLTSKAQKWLFDNNRVWDVFWLRGAAGVGKSAIAQTLAEFAVEHDRLGAAFFFSKSNGRKDPQRVFITIAYQLCVRFPGYQPLVAQQLAADPELLTKTPQVQFKKLIVEPLSQLSCRENKRLIILDGLDECEGEQVQLNIIELINNAVQGQISLPIIWMICSRPEPHLMSTFSRVDYPIQCWREVLNIDTEESRDDTALFIRARFKEIHSKYGDCVEEDVNGSWPSQDHITQIIDEASGLFIYASTVLKYIEDVDSGDPDARLAEVQAIIRRLHISGGSSPMTTLDHFYTSILSEIPAITWPVTRLVLMTLSLPPYLNITPWAICNILGITRSKFYTAMRRLHSVIHIPSFDKAEEEELHFFHASFGDFLRNPARSGRFCIYPHAGGVWENKPLAKTALQLITSPTLFLFRSNEWCPVFSPSILQLINPAISRVLNNYLTWSISDPHRVRHATSGLYDIAHMLIFAGYQGFPAHGDMYEDRRKMLSAFDFNFFTFAGLYRPMMDDFHTRHFIRWVMKTVCPTTTMLILEL